MRFLRFSLALFLDLREGPGVMPKAKTQPRQSRTKSIFIRDDLHLRLRVEAAKRDKTTMQDITDSALERELSKLEKQDT